MCKIEPFYVGSMRILKCSGIVYGKPFMSVYILLKVDSDVFFFIKFDNGDLKI